MRPPDGGWCVGAYCNPGIEVAWTSEGQDGRHRRISPYSPNYFPFAGEGFEMRADD